MSKIWNKNLQNLQAYLKKNGGQYPSSKSNLKLYNWVSTQRVKQKKGVLQLDRIKELNRNGFVWNPVKEKANSNMNKLVIFQKENKRWPVYDRLNKKTEESKLATFCALIRKSFREGALDENISKELEGLGFNFKGREDTWIEKFDSIKVLLDKMESFSVKELGESNYRWLLTQRKLYENDKLSESKKKRLKDLNIEQYFYSWEDKFKETKAFFESQGKLPTRKSNMNLHSWLMSQRVRYINKRLSSEQIRSLESIGFSLIPNGKALNDEKWFKNFEDYKKFKELNEREPSYFKGGKERQLYVWASSQRALSAGNLPNRNHLALDRIKALESINFDVIGKGKTDLITWKTRLSDLKKYIDPVGEVRIPTRINGKSNNLYIWYNRQKLKYRDGELSEEKIRLFKRSGINLELWDFQSQFDKWRAKIEGILIFIEGNKRLPHHSSKGKEKILYNLYSKTKRQYFQNKLSSDQIEFLNTTGLFNGLYD